MVIDGFYSSYVTDSFVSQKPIFTGQDSIQAVLSSCLRIPTDVNFYRQPNWLTLLMLNIRFAVRHILSYEFRGKLFSRVLPDFQYKKRVYRVRMVVENMPQGLVVIITLLGQPKTYQTLE